MVYDERGNYVGDMHWQSGWDFDVGEEVQLDRGGVIVQVSECVGQETQDLSGLLDKRVQEREQRLREKEQGRAHTATPRLSGPNLDSEPRPRPRPRVQQQTPGTPQIRHRPLTSLLGIPTGHLGRAVVSSESPFAQRQQANDATVGDAGDAERSAKRRRHEEPPSSKMGYAQNLFGATLSLSGTPSSSVRWPSQTVPRQTAARVPQRSIPDAETHVSTVQQYSDDDQPPAARRSPSLPPVSPKTHRSRRISPRQESASRAAPQVSQPTRSSHLNRSTPVLDRLQPARPQPHPPPKEVLDLTRSLEDDELRQVDTPAHAIRSSADDSNGHAGAANVLHRASNNALRTPVATEQPRPALGVSVVEEHASLPPERSNPPRESRRTELQLKSRKKRGLLVLSELVRSKPKEDARPNHVPIEEASSVGRKEAEAVQLEDDMFVGPDSLPDRGGSSDVLADASDMRLNSRRPARTLSGKDSDLPPAAAGKSAIMQTADDAENGNGKGKDVEVSKDRSRRKAKKTKADVTADQVQEPLDEPRTKRRSARKPTPKEQPILVNDEDQVEESHPEPGAKRRSVRVPAQKRPSSVISDDDEPSKEQDAHTMPTPLQGPRLVKFGRKSVRSKELIGFVVEDPVAPSSQYGGLSANITSAAPMTVNGIAQVSANDLEKASEVADTLQEAEKSTTNTDHAAAANVEPPANIAEPRRTSLSQLHNSVTGEVSGLENARPGEVISVERGTTPTPLMSRDAGDKEASDPQVDDLARPVEQEPTRGEPVAAKGPLDGGSSSLRQQSLVRGQNTTSTTNQEVQRGMAPNQPGRLVNPATRGRKAALKSHAAGQVPLPVLPLDMMTMQGVHQAQPRANDSTASGAGGAPAKRKMTFPGFVSAKKSGPWSREAHDLLDCERPGST
jgi:hypothetical protein